MIKYCIECLYPNTKPGLGFDERGVCDACISSKMKEKIDWTKKGMNYQKCLKNLEIQTERNMIVLFL